MFVSPDYSVKRCNNTDAPNIFAEGRIPGTLNALGSPGMIVTPDATVDASGPGLPAYDAGMPNGSKIIAVNGRRFSTDELSRAIAGSKGTEQPIEFIVDNAGAFSTITVDYHGGTRIPHFERVATTEDVLTQIAAPRVK